MTTPTALDLQGQLRYKALIRSQLDEIVGLAQEVITERVANGSMSPHQLGNVVAVVQESRSVPVVVNFIRYQMGRKEVSAWLEDRFGERLVETILEKIQPLAKQVADEAGVSLQDAWVDLTALFLGYTRRSFVARAKRRERRP